MTSSAGDLQAVLNAIDPSSPDRVRHLVDHTLAWAVRLDASDVHIEPTGSSVEVRMRIDGVVNRMATVPSTLGPNLVARLKVLAELLTYRVDIPQEGRLLDAIKRFGVEMRVSSFPTIHGEKVVVRVFDAGSRTLDLDQLGMRESHRIALERALASRMGSILLTGPSGSGKTTTIYACLRHLVRTAAGRQIVTIEDPVEQVLESVTQSQVRSGSEFDFARGLRSLLRQDPEVIMIGEIRDAETAAIAIEAALTGHLVISTVHSGSACGVIGRLLDMGIEPYLLTSGLTAVLNQRLVRRICDHCGASSRRELSCASCGGTGYRGRALLSEFLTMDEPLRRAVLAKADTTTIEQIAAQGAYRTLCDDAVRIVDENTTTWDEVTRVLGPDAIDRRARHSPTVQLDP